VGTSDRTFIPPDKQPLGTRRVYKVGWCTDIERRLKTLNSSFLNGVILRWQKYDARGFPSRNDAYLVEQQIFDWIRTQGISLGGKFIIGEFETVAGIQTRWFSLSAGKLGTA